MYTVTSDDKLYNSPFIGNGELATNVGPTGYHGGFCTEEEAVNRTLFWAGRRFKDARGGNIKIPRVAPEELFGATVPLIRFGRIDRTLTIDGAQTGDDNWRQTMDYDRATVISELQHGDVIETTESLVCRTFNMFVFHTRLENRGKASKKLKFEVDYVFGDAEGKRTRDTRLFIRKPHPDDIAFGDLGGVRSVETDLNKRPPHLKESLSVQYEIDMHLGEVHIGRYPLGIIHSSETGGSFIHDITLKAGETTDLWFWVVLSDRLKYSHFPGYDRVKALLEEHKTAWAENWKTSAIEIGRPEMEAIRKSSLYTIISSTSPWTITMGNQSTTWEGRIFHDEFFGYMGLLCSNFTELAERAPNHRLTILPEATRRSKGHGAFYAWEAIETGEESAPYGHWVDERFIHGQFSEESWQLYLRTGSKKVLARYYPVLRGCAEWLIYDAVIRDSTGKLRIRSMTDIDEGLYPVDGGIYVTCATIRSLENAADAATVLACDAEDAEHWRTLAAELRKSMPLSKEGKHYAYSDTADLPNGGGHLGIVFPFSVDIHSELALNTISFGYQSFLQGRDDKRSDQVLAYTWMWALSQLATALFYQGRADEGFDALSQVPSVVGPFMAPNEQMRDEIGVFLPWHPTGGGMYAFALSAMFVQVFDQNGAILLPALPSALPNVRFHGLLATDGVTVSGELRDGKPVRLNLKTDKSMPWRFRIPKERLVQVQLRKDLKISPPDSLGRVFVDCKLQPGDNALVAAK